MVNCKSILIGLSIMCTSAVFSVSFAGDCAIEEAKKAVLSVCDKAEDLEAVKKVTFCENNYVWAQKKEGDKITMKQHRIQPALIGKDLTNSKDQDGKAIFIEFQSTAEKNKDGGEVSYMWLKPGDEKPSPKKSFVKMCQGGIMLGAGVWLGK